MVLAILFHPMIQILELSTQVVMSKAIQVDSLNDLHLVTLLFLLLTILLLFIYKQREEISIFKLESENKITNIKIYNFFFLLFKDRRQSNIFVTSCSKFIFYFSKNFSKKCPPRSYEKNVLEDHVKNLR